MKVKRPLIQLCRMGRSGIWRIVVDLDTVPVQLGTYAPTEPKRRRYRIDRIRIAKYLEEGAEITLLAQQVIAGARRNK